MHTLKTSLQALPSLVHVSAGTSKPKLLQRYHHTMYSSDKHQRPANHIYQYSLIDALMDGVCENGITAQELCRSGNQALGTFHRMAGELTMIDGKVYRLKPGGFAEEVGPETEIPFAMSTEFIPQATWTVDLNDKAGIPSTLDAFAPKSKNLFRTYRITGVFEYLRCRTVEGQKYKGQPLVEVAKEQSVEEMADVEGTIIGFSSPAKWQGFTVAGEHSHFVRADGRAGGHVLEIRAVQVRVAMAVVSKVHMDLPINDEFNEATLVTDNAGLVSVEG